MSSPAAGCRRFFLACLLVGLGAVPAMAEEHAVAGGIVDFSVLGPGRHAVPPSAIKRATPEYPEALRRGVFVGRVLMEFIITDTGNVANPIVVRSNNPWFERAALDSILKWKFKPGEVDGRPVNVRAQQLLQFELDNGGQPLWTVNKGKNREKLPPEFQWDKAPEPVATAFPVYPLAALQASQKGTVNLVFIVDPQGKVIKPQIAEATTPEMGAAVLAMIDAWSFTPAIKKDKTPCYAGISIQFSFQPFAGRGDVPFSEEMDTILHELKRTPSRIVPIGALDAVPRPLSRRPPIYPSTLRSAGEEGAAVVEFYIDSRGDVQLPHIISSSAPEFGYAAVQAIATWRYEVPKKAGKPVIARAQIALDFTLKPGAGGSAPGKK
jgi:TonB family protein